MFRYYKMSKEVYTVSKLNTSIKDILTGAFPKIIKVEGEISNFKLSRGHLYFNLKDDDSSISCTYWSYQSSKYKDLDIKDGKSIIVSGNINVYVKSGYYQIRVNTIELCGIGDIHANYIEVKKKYQQKGFFDNDRKKPMPKNIKSVGIITALDGAALKDVMYVLTNNGFSGKVYVKGCMVQGKKCPLSVSQCIKEMNETLYNGEHLDVILVTRGGGSFEDLMGFSDPLIIEAMYDSNICTISAIGHEVDSMLSDYAADIRAPTPSIAGEVISSHQKKLIDEIKMFTTYLSDTVKYSILADLYNNENKLLEYLGKTDKAHHLIDKYRDNIKRLYGDLREHISKDVHNKIIRLKDLESYAESVNPYNSLEQGCAIITNKHDTIIKRLDQIKKGEKLNIRFIDGIANIKIDSINE